MKATTDHVKALVGIVGDSFPTTSEDWFDLALRAQRFSKSHPEKSSAQQMKWLLSQYLHRLGLHKLDYPQEFYLRAFFLKEYSWDEMALIFSIGVPQVKSKVFNALLNAVSEESVFTMPTRDCARNDIYLLDKLMGCEWKNTLDIHSTQLFEAHLNECVRCKKVYENSVAYIISLKEKANQELQQFDKIMVAHDDLDLPLNLWSDLSWTALFVRAGSLLVLALLIFGVVVSIPTWKNMSEYTVSRWRDLQQIWFTPQKEKAVVAVAPVDEEPVEIVREDEPEVEAEEDALVVVAADPVAEIETKKPEAVEPKIVKEEKQIVAKNEHIETRPETPKIQTTKLFYRWGARAQDPDRIAARVQSLIEKKSAQNAGELPFGAEYRGGRYFHFMIDKDSYSDLLAELRALPLSDFTDSAAESDRQIPANRSRIVLWIGPAQ